jgi:pyridoxine 5-phosphate synthase
VEPDFARLRAAFEQRPPAFLDAEQTLFLRGRACDYAPARHGRNAGGRDGGAAKRRRNRPLARDGAKASPAAHTRPASDLESADVMAAIDTRLSVNLNKVALLRNQRDVGYPSVLDAARLVVKAGAHGITVHPRPDERHIRRTDATELAALIRNEFGPNIEYNIEGFPTPEFIELIGEVRPDQVTLVPDAPDQRTSDHGWDLKEPRRLRPLIRELKASGARISLFMDPDPGIIATAATVGADRIELYTGPYAAAFPAAEAQLLLRRYVQAAEAAMEAGLGVNAGHDLNLDNLPAFCQAVPQLAEVSIGHAITADALRIGFPDAVEAYLLALKRIGPPTDQSPP